jgi:hypothetical protein
MEYSKQEYYKKVKKASPKLNVQQPSYPICGWRVEKRIGQMHNDMYAALGKEQSLCPVAATCTLKVLTALLTGFIFLTTSQEGGCGHACADNGFSNSVVSPAQVCKTEGMNLGWEPSYFSKLAGDLYAHCGQR